MSFSLYCQQFKFLRLRPRLGRVRYLSMLFINTLISTVLLFGVGILVGLISVFSFGVAKMHSQHVQAFTHHLILWLTIPIMIVFSINGFFLLVRRLHDANLSAHWLWPYLAIPLFIGVGALFIGVGAFSNIVAGLGVILFIIYGIIVGCITMFKPGVAGENRFGPAASLPNTGYDVTGCVLHFVIIVLLGIYILGRAVAPHLQHHLPALPY